MNKFTNPASVAKPAGNYTHCVEVTAGARQLYISGQIGVLPDGSTAQGIAAQADAVWSNIANILKAADMAIADLVKITVLVVNPADIPAVRTVRDRYLGTHKPASTLMVAAGLASPAYLLEIEAIAAKG
jgi:enamine deaminase RidA (YjgF/YER057c/UK114 family)